MSTPRRLKKQRMDEQLYVRYEKEIIGTYDDPDTIDPSLFCGVCREPFIDPRYTDPTNHTFNVHIVSCSFISNFLSPILLLGFSSVVTSIAVTVLYLLRSVPYAKMASTKQLRDLVSSHHILNGETSVIHYQRNAVRKGVPSDPQEMKSFPIRRFVS